MEKKVITIAARIMGADPDLISADTVPEDIEAWDSLRHIRLLLAVEEEFSVKFSVDDIVSIRGIRDILDRLEQARVKVT